jgi:hypothetical protein
MPSAYTAGAAVPLGPAMHEDAVLNMRDFEALARLSRHEHDEIFRQGTPPSVEELLGFDFCGWNCSLLSKLGGFQKFIKGFAPGPEHRPGEAEGFNVTAIQNGLDGEWLGLPADDEPRQFGFYTVTRLDRTLTGTPAGALLLDYGAHPANRCVDPLRLLRDVVVKVEGDTGLFLGRAHLALGAWVFVGYFLLRRRHALPHLSGVGPE